MARILRLLYCMSEEKAVRSLGQPVNPHITCYCLDFVLRIRLHIVKNRAQQACFAPNKRRK
uniref:Haloalkane dehalogenase isoform X2 n=1 Tax=Rhizophora mucronata TaxID=61149 RepID=A0A2P2LNJ4_RHIMU